MTAPAFRAPEEVKTSGFLVDPRDVLKSASALQDVSRYVQSLPGVVIGTNDFRNDLIVRGGSPLENLFIVDNVEIPNINTFANFASAGGTVSILDAELLRDVTFLTGGYPAPYLNRTSSVLQVTQREGSRQEFGGWATLGFAGVGTILEGPVNGGKGSWIVSARRSFLDFFTDDVGVGGVPVLSTLNAKAVYDLTPRDRVWVVNISGWDNIRLGYTDTEAPEDELSTLDIRYEGWRSAAGFNWQRLFGSRGVGLLGVTHSEAKVGQRVKDLALEGPPPTGDADEAVEVYGKRYADYPVASALPSVSLANIGDTFNVREILFPLTSAGRGRASGVELFVEKRLSSKLYGQGNLAFSQTRHAALDGVWRPGSFDHPFVLNLTGGYQFRSQWELSTRIAVLGGRPYTPYDEIVSTDQRRGVYDLTRVNAERGPAYARIDVRVDRTFTVGGRSLNVFAGVQNLTNRRNFAGYQWNRHLNALDVNEQQGIFPIVGFDWRF